jgi:hypothetical protein
MSTNNQAEQNQEPTVQNTAQEYAQTKSEVIALGKKHYTLYGGLAPTGVGAKRDPKGGGNVCKI